MSVFSEIFGPGPFDPPETPKVDPRFMQALRAAAKAWLNEHPKDKNAGLVKAALLATNPK